MPKLLLASDNIGKQREIEHILKPLGFSIHTQGEFGISPAEEPHQTFLENALTKARHASRLSGLPALADDSGICSVALNGAPGVLSARYAGEPVSDARNNEKLRTALAGCDRRVYYVCVLVVVRGADDPRPVVSEGEWCGEFIDSAAGENGFGYDPHFWIPEKGCTAAQLPSAEKNQISHRAQALSELLTRIKWW